MSYTTIANVAGMFPTFVTGANQKPSNALIQQYIDDVAGDLDAILQKRFGEAIMGSPYNGSFAAFQAAFSLDATNVLEKINRYGAAAQLGATLATFGVAAAERLGKDSDAEYEELRNRLEARDANGKGETSGMYDHLFDPQALVESPRPGFQGIAGADQPRGQTADDLGMSSVFSKFDRRES